MLAGVTRRFIASIHRPQLQQKIVGEGTGTGSEESPQLHPLQEADPQDEEGEHRTASPSRKPLNRHIGVAP